MAYQTEFSLEDGVLRAELCGQFPLELLRTTENVFSPAICAGAGDGCRKLLIDARQLEVTLDAANLFRVGVDAAELSHQGIRVAFVARADMIDHFFEDVTRNRGGVVAVFTDVEKAREWLAR